HDLRVPHARGRAGRPELVHRSSKARRLSKGLRRIRSGQGRALHAGSHRKDASRSGHRSKPPQGDLRRQQREAVSRSAEGIRIFRRVHLEVRRRQPGGKRAAHDRRLSGAHRNLGCDQQGSHQARLSIRRLDDRLRAHAGHRPRQRSLRRLLPQERSRREAAQKMTRRSTKKPARSASQAETSGPYTRPTSPAAQRPVPDASRRSGDSDASRQRVADEHSGDSVLERLQALARQTGTRMAALAVTLGFFAIVAVVAARTNTPTPDEFVYVPAGYYHLTTGDLTFDSTNPPLLKMLMALPLLSMDLHVDTDPRRRDNSTGWGAWIFGTSFMDLNRVPYLDAFFRSRLVIVLLGVALGVLVFVRARELLSPAGALVALLLYGTMPPVIAHASVATLDVGISLALFAALFAATRFAKS